MTIRHLKLIPKFFIITQPTVIEQIVEPKYEVQLSATNIHETKKSQNISDSIISTSIKERSKGTTLILGDSKISSVVVKLTYTNRRVWCLPGVKRHVMLHIFMLCFCCVTHHPWKH